MFSIGDLARLGRVSVRMPRHHDGIGLLPPARVDHATGNRWYDAAQLAALDRVVALKELGFSLAEVGTLLEEQVPVAELRGMLRLRRAELEARIVADSGRLAALSAPAAGFEPRAITPVIQPLYDRLMMLPGKAGVSLVGPGAPVTRAEQQRCGAVR